MEVNNETRIIDLTVGQLFGLLDAKVKEMAQAAQPPAPTEAEQNKEPFVYGIAGIASLFGCSKRTAQRIKDGGEFSEAIFQHGKQIIIDVQAVRAIQRERNKFKLKQQ